MIKWNVGSQTGFWNRKKDIKKWKNSGWHGGITC